MGCIADVVDCCDVTVGVYLDCVVVVLGELCCGTV